MPQHLTATYVERPVMSSNAPSLFNQSAMVAATWPDDCFRGPRTAHSHTVATRQPSSSNLCVEASSRAALLAIFNCQLQSGGILKAGQLCWCQKQPCTKITALYLVSTKSGVPLSFFECRRKRNPNACKALRTASSAAESLFLIARIFRERVSRSCTSGTFALGAGSLIM